MATDRPSWELPHFVYSERHDSAIRCDNYADAFKIWTQLSAWEVESDTPASDRMRYYIAVQGRVCDPGSPVIDPNE